MTTTNRLLELKDAADAARDAAWAAALEAEDAADILRDDDWADYLLAADASDAALSAYRAAEAEFKKDKPQ